MMADCKLKLRRSNRPDAIWRNSVIDSFESGKPLRVKSRSEVESAKQAAYGLGLSWSYEWIAPGAWTLTFEESKKGGHTR